MDAVCSSYQSPKPIGLFAFKTNFIVNILWFACDRVRQLIEFRAVGEMWEDAIDKYAPMIWASVLSPEALSDAAHHNELHVFNMLLYAIEERMRFNFLAVPSCLYQPLEVAIKFNHKELTDRLMISGLISFDVRLGQIAIKYRNVYVMQILLDNGLSVKYRDLTGNNCSFLEDAVSNTHGFANTTMIDLLLYHGKKPMAKSYHLVNIIEKAAESGCHIDDFKYIVNCFLETGKHEYALSNIMTKATRYDIWKLIYLLEIGCKIGGFFFDEFFRGGDDLEERFARIKPFMFTNHYTEALQAFCRLRLTDLCLLNEIMNGGAYIWHVKHMDIVKQDISVIRRFIKKGYDIRTLPRDIQNALEARGNV
jgi:hypothetical protein